jgi:D-alanyl-D-alanine dipeptidase
MSAEPRSWLTDPAAAGLAASDVPPAEPIRVPERLTERARDVPVADDGEPLVPVEGRLELHRVYAQLPFHSMPPRVLLRRSALDALVAARDALPAPFSLVVIDGWRSKVFQAELLDYYSARHESVAGFVSDPEDTVLLPPHVAGAAVDLTLTHLGRPLALGTDFDALVPEAAVDWFETAPNGSSGAELARRLRRLLAVALLGAGFSPLAEEWWHWSFGDQRWAVFCGADHARYGLISA